MCRIVAQVDSTGQQVGYLTSVGWMSVGLPHRVKSIGLSWCSLNSNLREVECMYLDSLVLLFDRKWILQGYPFSLVCCPCSGILRVGLLEVEMKTCGLLSYIGPEPTCGDRSQSTCIGLIVICRFCHSLFTSGLFSWSVVSSRGRREPLARVSGLDMVLMQRLLRSRFCSETRGGSGEVS